MELSPRLAGALRKAEAKLAPARKERRPRSKLGRKTQSSKAGPAEKHLVRASKRPNTAPGPMHSLEESVRRNPNSFSIM